MNAIGAYCSHGVQTGAIYFESWAKLPKARTKKERVSLFQRVARYGLRAEEVGPIDTERVVRFLWRVAVRPENAGADWKRERLLILMLDNYSVHKSARVQAERAKLRAAGVVLWYLPAYSPEMSAIEPIWQDVKHHRMRRRSHEQLRDLKTEFDTALTGKAVALKAALREAARSLHRAA